MLSFHRKYALDLCSASLDQLFLKEGHPKLYKGPVPSNREVLLQIANGLNYMHSKELLHGDLKPRSVLIFTDPSSSTTCIKVGLNRSGQSGRNWMAPERLAVLIDAEDGDQVEGSCPVTVAGDIFSAGCIFSYFVMRGVHPFGTKSTVISQNIILGNPISISSRFCVAFLLVSS